MVTTAEVWKVIDEEIFGVLAFSNAKGEPRSAGIWYTVEDRQLLIPSARSAWKVRHIEANPAVSMTITIPKRIPFMPFLKIPAATITFQGTATIEDVDALSAGTRKALFRGLEMDQDLARDTAVIRVTPHGDFVTYGVAMPMTQMRKPELASGRAPTGRVAASREAATG